jgi:hypothetical protein
MDSRMWVSIDGCVRVSLCLITLGCTYVVARVLHNVRRQASFSCALCARLVMCVRKNVNDPRKLSGREWCTHLRLSRASEVFDWLYVCIRCTSVSRFVSCKCSGGGVAAPENLVLVRSGIATHSVLLTQTYSFISFMNLELFRVAVHCGLGPHCSAVMLHP